MLKIKISTKMQNLSQETELLLSEQTCLEEWVLFKCWMFDF